MQRSELSTDDSPLLPSLMDQRLRRRDGSVFSEASLWTALLVEEVQHRAFVEHPDFGKDDSHEGASFALFWKAL